MSDYESYIPTTTARNEYLELPRQNYEEAVQALINVIEYVTFEDVRTPHGSFECKEGVTERRYAYIRKEADAVGSYSIQTGLRIQHMKTVGGGDAYSVGVDWKPLLSEDDSFFVKEYFLESYPGGVQFLTMREPDLIPNDVHSSDPTYTVSTRTMTAYDVGQLLKELNVMANSLQTESV